MFLYFSHGEAKECTKNIISVCKFFSIDNSPAHCHQKAKACIGPTNEKIKNYVMKSPSGFGGSKSIIKAAQTLLPNKFFEDDSNNLVHSMEIQYILNNEPSTDTYFVLEKEPEEDIFTNGSSIVAKILNIRKSHEAYSHSKHSHKVSNIMRLDNAHENINTNTANQLITQITSNDSGQTVRRRVTR
ncbi:20866_t:CDS:2 [Entrophospora sp. SA101]|nr:20866_t:CDS:2 [Entrophospora sp. SA101]